MQPTGNAQFRWVHSSQNVFGLLQLCASHHPAAFCRGVVSLTCFWSTLLAIGDILTGKIAKVKGILKFILRKRYNIAPLRPS